MNRRKKILMRAVITECTAAIKAATEAILTDDENTFNAYAKVAHKAIHDALDAEIQACVEPYETSESETTE